MLSKNHCCLAMEEIINNPDSPLGYSLKIREYYLAFDNQRVIVNKIDYCPWCGNKLPISLRDNYFEILEQEYHIEADIESHKKSNFPKEFTTDEWWKKRGL